MGLFDFFRRPPTPEKFAESLMAELRRRGVTDELAYDRDNDRVLIGTGKDRQIVNLTNFYKEHVALPRSARRQHLSDRARIVSEQKEPAADFDQARANLRPKLWVRAALEMTRLQIKLDGGDPDLFDISEYAVGSHLIAGIAYDMPDAIVSVSKEQLSNWGVSYYEALEIARENLEQAPFRIAEIGKGCYAFATGDSYDACRLLLPGQMAQLEVKGDLIAMVPNRDALLVTGSNDRLGLQIMLDLAAKAGEDPRPMVPIPLRLDGDDWVDWKPPRDHPLSAGFHDLARLFFLEIYGDQKKHLEELDERDAIDRFVASYTVVTKADGKKYSYAVWSNGVKAILPRAEWVMFFRGEKDMPAIAPWERVEQVVGRLMTPTDDYPQRFLVEEFPSDAELARLGKGEP